MSLLILVFSIFYTFHGVFVEQPAEIIVLVATTGVVLCYILLNYFENVDTRDKVKLVCREY